MAHPVPFNLFDPLNISKNRTPEEKERGLLIELNNVRRKACARATPSVLGPCPTLPYLAPPFLPRECNSYPRCWRASFSMSGFV